MKNHACICLALMITPLSDVTQASTWEHLIQVDVGGPYFDDWYASVAEESRTSPTKHIELKREGKSGDFQVFMALDCPGRQAQFGNGLLWRDEVIPGSAVRAKIPERLVDAALVQYCEDEQSSAIAERSTNLPDLLSAESYGVVRTKMIAAGWEPMRLEDADQCEKGDSRCSEWPDEMHACRSDGYAPCRFTWTRDEMIVGVCTRGTPPVFFGLCSDVSDAAGVGANPDILEEPAWSTDGENYFIEAEPIVKAVAWRLADPELSRQIVQRFDVEWWGRCEQASRAQRFAQSSGVGLPLSEAEQGALLMGAMEISFKALGQRGSGAAAEAERERHEDRLLTAPEYFAESLGACLERLDETLEAANMPRYMKAKG